MEAPSVAPPNSGGSSGLEVWQVVVPAMIAVLLAIADVVLVVFLLIRWRRRRGSGSFALRAVNYAAVTPTVNASSLSSGPKMSSVLTVHFHQKHQETKDLPPKHWGKPGAPQEPEVPSSSCSVVETQPAVHASQRPDDYCIVARNPLAAKQELGDTTPPDNEATDSPSLLAIGKTGSCDSHPIPKFVIISETDRHQGKPDAPQEPEVPSSGCSVVKTQPAVHASQRPDDYCIVTRNPLAAKQELGDTTPPDNEAPDSPSIGKTGSCDSHPIPKFVIISEADKVAHR